MKNLFRPARVVPLLVFATAVLAGPAMADEVFFTVRIGSQLVQGEVTSKGMEGKMRAIKVAHELRQPYDPATGQLTGQRVLAPIKITRERGRASPRLMQAVFNNEMLQEVVVEYWALQRTTGTMKQMQTVRLTNARIVGIEHSAEQIEGSPLGQVRPVETISIAYQTIEYKDVESGAEATGQIGTPF